MGLDTKIETKEDVSEKNQYMKGVRYLSQSGLTKVPSIYILPVSDRPCTISMDTKIKSQNFKLPIIDLAQLQSLNRSQALISLAEACERHGFFQVINHGIPSELIRSVIDMGRQFFELPFEERSRYMSSDMMSPVRCGTSFNQIKDRIFFWRDFLKLSCHLLEKNISHWPTSPTELRRTGISYAKHNKSLFLILMEAILENLGLKNMSKNSQEKEEEEEEEEEDILRQLDDGSQLMVINCYPSCPEPELTLGMPPHSDYGFLTLLLQDGVEGLQIKNHDEWVTVNTLSNSIVVNIGDHLEIFSNGKYKSVIHRVVANSQTTRISIACLHSVPFDRVVRPSLKLITKENPQMYRDTDFYSFMQFLSCSDTKQSFIDSQKLK